MNDCLNCGDPAHPTPECHRPKHAYIQELRPSDPSQLAKTVATSLKGAELGRRAGWRTAQSKAAEVALNEIPDTELGLRVFKKIMDLVDR